MQSLWWLVQKLLGHLFQPKTKVRPLKKDVTTEPSVETTTKGGETDTNKQTPEDSDNTKPSSETLIKQEIEESKDDGEATAPLTDMCLQLCTGLRRITTLVDPMVWADEF